MPAILKTKPLKMVTLNPMNNYEMLTPRNKFPKKVNKQGTNIGKPVKKPSNDLLNKDNLLLVPESNKKKPPAR